MNLAIARRKPRSPAPKILEVRSLVPADLEHLRNKSIPARVKNIKEAHHNVARLLAAGLSNREVANRLGYTEARISNLKHDPSVAELIAHYRAEVTDSWRESVDMVHHYATKNMLTGERMIAEHLEDADERGEKLPLRELLALTADRQDRFGYGKRQTNVNFNIDFAKRLETAISRSRKVIEAE